MAPMLLLPRAWESQHLGCDIRPWCDAGDCPGLASFRVRAHVPHPRPRSEQVPRGTGELVSQHNVRPGPGCVCGFRFQGPVTSRNSSGRWVAVAKRPRSGLRLDRVTSAGYVGGQPGCVVRPRVGTVPSVTGQLFVRVRLVGCRTT